MPRGPKGEKRPAGAIGNCPLVRVRRQHVVLKFGLDKHLRPFNGVLRRRYFLS